MKKTELFTPLQETYTRMDRKWNAVARVYGFHCNGCKDNCCRSLFFHHTYVEKAYLLHGFSRLSLEKQQQLLARAATYIKATFGTAPRPESKKIMCPVNEDGRCLLYAFRPMICRLHGLPHELRRPGSAPLKGPGCRAGGFTKKTYTPLDRTPFYVAMAQVETGFRTTTQQTGKIKETIAHMLLSFRPGKEK